MRNVTRRRNLLYCAAQGSYWMVYCVGITFASYFLLQNGFSNTEVGIVLALGYIAGMLFQPLLAAVADRCPKLGTPGMLLIGVAGCVGSLTVLLFLRGHSLLLCGTFVLFLGLTLGLQPLVNAFAFYLERLHTAISFGVARGCGSGIYAVFAIIIGRLSAEYGAPMLPWAGLTACALLVLFTLLLRREGRPEAPSEKQARGKLSPRVLRKNYSGFLVLLLGTFGIFCGHSLVSNFLMQIVENAGGDSGDLGALSSYTALLEIPAMVLFDRLERKISCVSMIKFAAIFFVLKGVLLVFGNSIPALYLIFLTQIFSFAVLTPASVRYVNRVMPQELENTAQALLTLMVTAANTLFTAISGYMIDSMGMRTTLLVGAAMSAVGAAAIVIGMKQPKRVAVAAVSGRKE